MVRKFASTDAADAFALAKDSPESAQWSLASYQDLARVSDLVWVSAVAGQIIGLLVARAAAGEAEILNLVISRDHRRSGQACALCTAAALEFARLGVTRVFLEVRESNQPALQFYERQGFQRAGFRKAYYHDPPENAVLMEKKLTG